MTYPRLTHVVLTDAQLLLLDSHCESPSTRANVYAALERSLLKHPDAKKHVLLTDGELVYLSGKTGGDKRLDALVFEARKRRRIRTPRSEEQIAIRREKNREKARAESAERRALRAQGISVPEPKYAERRRREVGAERLSPHGRLKVTPEVKARILEVVAANPEMNAEQIAARFGLATHTVTKHVGGCGDNTHRPVTKAEVARMVELKTSGMTAGEVSAEVGRSVACVLKHLRAAGVKMQKGPKGAAWRGTGALCLTKRAEGTAEVAE